MYQDHEPLLHTDAGDRLLSTPLQHVKVKEGGREGGREGGSGVWSAREARRGDGSEEGREHGAVVVW